VLALVTGVQDWLYPLSILVATTLVFLMHGSHRRWLGSKRASTPETEEVPPRQRFLVAVAVAAFAFGVAALAMASGQRFLLFPPVVVIAYELIENPHCPWAGRPFAIIAACFISATVGWSAAALLGFNALSVAVVVALAVATLAALRLRMPPAIAVGLLPFLSKQGGWRFSAAIAAGAALAVVFGLVWGKLRARA
jgi:CBS-domain-containing membrane protein